MPADRLNGPQRAADDARPGSVPKPALLLVNTRNRRGEAMRDATARVLAAGRTRSIDVGQVNGCAYLNAASIGFGVDPTRAPTRDSKRRLGAPGYAVFHVLRGALEVHAP